MDAIIDLLDKKNHLLKKFFTLNKAEILRLQDGDFAHLDDFYKIRENTLDMVGHVDVMVEEILNELGPEPVFTNEQRESVRVALAFKDELVSQILDQDLRILELIENAKSEIIKELSQTQQSRKIISAYAGRP